MDDNVSLLVIIEADDSNVFGNEMASQKEVYTWDLYVPTWAVLEQNPWRSQGKCIYERGKASVSVGGVSMGRRRLIELPF